MQLRLLFGSKMVCSEPTFSRLQDYFFTLTVLDGLTHGIPYLPCRHQSLDLGCRSAINCQTRFSICSLHYCIISSSSLSSATAWPPLQRRYQRLERMGAPLLAHDQGLTSSFSDLAEQTTRQRRKIFFLAITSLIFLDQWLEDQKTGEKCMKFL